MLICRFVKENNLNTNEIINIQETDKSVFQLTTQQTDWKPLECNHGI